MNNINELLKDLYEIDPSLKEHDKELRGILTELIEARPDIQMDEDFVQSLRLQLAERAQIQTEKRTDTGWMKKLAFALSAPALIVILFLTVTYFPVGQSALFTNEIKMVGQSAFDLTGGSASEGSPTALSARTESAPVVSSDTAVSAPAVSAVGLEGNGTTASSAKMMPPYPGGEQARYNYVYDGELPIPTESQMGVFKRLATSVNDRAFTSALKGFDFGLLDIKSFDSLKAEYMSFLEDKEYGYGVQVSFTEGVININQNWSKWPNPYNDCKDDACYQRLALKPGDVPSDEELIGMADGFLKEHGIKLENYGPAKVISNQPVLYRAAEDSAPQQMPAYVPEYVSLVYPEQVDGKNITEGDGAPSGISVSISVRDKKVTAVNNLRAGSFEKSLYDTETDSASLLSWANRGGVNYWEYSDPEAKQVDIKLGTPEIIYYKFYKWNQDENRNEEYFIPAYSFPIEKTADYQLYRTNILVPVIKGLKDLNPEQGAVPVPYMMK